MSAPKVETNLNKSVDYNSVFGYASGEDTKIGDVLTVPKSSRDLLDYPEWAPTWDPKDNYKFNHLKPFKHIDRGLSGDSNFSSLLENKNIKFKKITPKLGLEVDGIQLSSLTNKQKDDLALLIEKSGVVAFRNQDFKDKGFEFLKNWAKYFGPLDIHANSGAPINNPEFHLVFKRDDFNDPKNIFNNKLNQIYWHSDVSYETQPPGITLLAMLQTGLGGDTQFLDTIEIYDRLSPLLKEKLNGLKVLHSSKLQAEMTKEGGLQRKETIESIHPLIRYHPVLKKNLLYLNKVFGRRILGLKQEESENLFNFLINHIENCLDAHIRVQWDANTVVLWDNRRVLHTATADFDSIDIRHAFRLTTIAERPVENQTEYENWSPELEEENIKLTNYYLNLPPAKYYEVTKK